MNAVITAIRRQLPQLEGEVLVGFSGGADSTALLHSVFSQKKGQVTAVHINHGLRGSDAEADEAFVRRFCAEFEIPLEVAAVDVRAEAEKRGLSIEHAARELRYDIFVKTAMFLNITKVLTAHNSGDNLETMIYNLARGSIGLVGIPLSRPLTEGIIVYRPLLGVSRADIEKYLTENGLSHVEDLSNQDTVYTRNLIRHQIVPLLEKINPKVSEHAFRNAVIREYDSETLSNELTVDAVNQLSQELGALYVKKLLKSHGISPTYAYITAVLNICRNGSPHAVVNLPMGRSVKRVYNILSIENTIKTDNVSRFNSLFKILQINADTIVGKLYIRKRQQGDSITFPKMGTKSLKKLFIDKKIPMEERDRIPILCDEAGIVAIVGIGVTARCVPCDGAKILSITVEAIDGEYIITEACGEGQMNEE